MIAMSTMKAIMDRANTRTTHPGMSLDDAKAHPLLLAHHPTDQEAQCNRYDQEDHIHPLAQDEVPQSLITVHVR